MAATASLYPTTVDTTVGTTWAATTNATGATAATFATFTNTASGGSGTIRLSGYAVRGNTNTGVQPTSIDSVSVTVANYVDNVSRTASITVQLYSGTTAIGTPTTLTRSTTTTNSQTVTLTGANCPTWAQLADLRAQVVFTRTAVTQANVFRLDYVGIVVNYTATSVRNDCPAPRGDTSGWSGSGSTGAVTTTNVAATGMQFTTATRTVNGSAAGNLRIVAPHRIYDTDIGGQVRTHLIQVKSNVAVTNVVVEVVFRNAAGAQTGTVVNTATGVSIAAGGTAWLTWSGTAPAGTFRENAAILCRNAPANATVYGTAARYEAGDQAATIVYADGDTDGWQWEGATGQSTSTNAAIPATHQAATAMAGTGALTVSASTVTPNPKIESLATDFTSGIPGFFDGNFGAPFVDAGGVGHVPCTNAYGAFNTAALFDGTGSYTYAKVTPPNSGPSTQASIQWNVDNDNRVEFLHDGTGGGLVGRVAVAGVVTDYSIGALNTTTHAWWRVRESGGTVFWDTSPDGLTWTNRASATHGLDLTAVNLQLLSGYWGTETAPPDALFDNLNTPPVTTVTFQGAVDMAGAGTLSVAATRIQPAAVAMSGAGAFASNATRAVTPAVSMAGSGSFSSTATRAQIATTAMAGAGGLGAAVTRAHPATVTMAGAGELTATSTRTQSATVTMTGAGSLSVTPTRVQAAAAPLAGAGSLSVTPTHGQLSTTALAGSGSLTAATILAQASSTNLAGAGALNAAALRGAVVAAPLAGVGLLGVGAVRGVNATAALAGASGLGADATRQQFGAALLSSAGALTVTAARTAEIATTLISEGVLAVDAVRAQLPTAALAGASALLVDVAGTTSGAFELAGQGMLDAATARTATASSTLAGESGLVAAVGRTARVAVALVGDGTLGVAAERTIHATVTLAGNGVLASTAGSTGATGADLIGSGALSTAAARTGATTAVLVGASALTTTASRVATVAADLVGAGSLVVATTRAALGATTLSGESTLGTVAGGATDGGTGLTAAGTLDVLIVRSAIVTTTLAGTGALATTAYRGMPLAATFAAAGSLGIAAARVQLGSVALSGEAALAASGVRAASGALGLTGDGSLVTSGDANAITAVNLAGAGALLVSVSVTRFGQTTLTGVGSLTLAAFAVLLGNAAHLTGAGTLNAAGLHHVGSIDWVYATGRVRTGLAANRSPSDGVHAVGRSRRVELAVDRATGTGLHARRVVTSGLKVKESSRS